MKIKKKLISSLVCTTMVLGLVAYSTETSKAETSTATGTGELATGDTSNDGTIKVTAPEKPFSLNLAETLSNGDYTWEFVDNGDNDYYKLINVIYVANANYYEWSTSNAMGTQSYSAYIQSMDIFVPAGYVEKVDENGSLVFNSEKINGYTADTAPIVFENNNAGYLTGLATDIVSNFKDNTNYMENGFIYVNAGSRGRDIAGSPASIVDLKAAIRYLRANDKVLPGNTNEIVSVGTSGGGAISSLVGATGNMDDYYSYLYEAGAAGVIKEDDKYTSTIKDDVYAAQLYCPIADIENADLAYAWMRYDSNVNGTYTFTPYQKALEKDMAGAYVNYLNSLNLRDENGTPLTLDSTRKGTYYDSILNEISKAFNAFIAAEAWKTIEVSEGMGQPKTTPYKDMTMEEWLAAMYGDTSSWLKQNSDGTYQVTDMAAYLEGISLARNKDIPGFDDLNQSKEGNAFSTDPNEHVHFSKSIYNVMLENNDTLSKIEGYDSNYLTAYDAANDEATAERVYLYSTMQILEDKNQKSDVAKYWRMRNGTADQHTSFSVNYNIALTLLKYVPGVDVDYALVWNMGHGSDEGTTTGTLVDWVNEICHKNIRA